MRQPLASGDLWKDDDDVFVRPDRFFFGKREREIGRERGSERDPRRPLPRQRIRRPTSPTRQLIGHAPCC